MKKRKFKQKFISSEEQQINFINEENQKLKKSQLLNMAKKASKKKKSCLFISIIILSILIIGLAINFIIMKINEKRKQNELIENEFIYEFIENAKIYNYVPLVNEELNIDKIRHEINMYKRENILSYEHLEYLYKRDEPKISIIISANNNAKYLKYLYSSIFNQSLKDIEIIFVNEISSNKADNMIKEYMKLDKRIVLINNLVNPYDLNGEYEGVKIAKGKYIFFANIYDLLINNILEKSYIMAEKYNLDVTQFYLINEKFKKIDILDFMFNNKTIYQPQIEDIFYYSKMKFLYDKLIKKDTFLKAVDFIDAEYRNKLYEINEKDCIVYGLINVSQSYGFLNQVGYYYNKRMHGHIMKTKIKNNLEEIFRSLFTVMQFFYKKTDETRKEKLMVGYKYFYTKIYEYKKYIKYLRYGFDYINEAIDLYLNTTVLVNVEKFYLLDFQHKINERKNNRK